MASQVVATLFGQEIDSGIGFFSGGKDIVDYVPITSPEQKTVDYVFNAGINLIQKVSPNVANDLSPQRTLTEKFAGVVKASISTTGGVKPITFPSTPGSISLNWLTPEMLRYISTRSTTNSAYTDYANDTWTLALVAGTPTFILGTGTYTQNTPPTTAPTLTTSSNFFQGSQQSQAHSMFLFYQHGLIEVGTTPSMQQFQLYSQTLTKYGIWSVNGLNEMPIETNKAIYQYNTIGALPVYYDLGVVWAGMPIVTKNSQIKPMAMCFYEHSFAPTLVYV